MIDVMYTLYDTTTG